MKKEYVVPSAEMLTFDYTEAVVASGTIIGPGGPGADGHVGPGAGGHVGPGNH